MDSRLPGQAGMRVLQGSLNKNEQRQTGRPLPRGADRNCRSLSSLLARADFSRCVDATAGAAANRPVPREHGAC